MSTSGETLLDSGWNDGNVFDWKPQVPLLDGQYKTVITVRDVKGDETATNATLVARDGEMKLGPTDVPTPAMTTLMHDGTNGAIVTTRGDLSFRSGDLLIRNDVERMRLTSDGLVVYGPIRANGGIVFSDGTVLDAGAKRAPQQPGAAPVNAVAPSMVSTMVRVPTRLAPKSFAPAYQFVTNATGVTIGTTNPDYKLDVAGPISTATRYDINGARFVSNGGVFGFNTFLGISAGNLTTTGNNLTALGAGAMPGDTSGANNTAVGYSSLNSNTDASDNTAVGYQALNTNQHGTQNTAIGSGSLYWFEGSATATGNTAVGYQALYGAIGTSGIFNTAVGRSALYSITSGGSNTAVGNRALINGTATSGNTVIGEGAMFGHTNGNSLNGGRNTAVGAQALYNNNGNLNLAIGYQAGFDNVSGSNNIFIKNSGGVTESSTIRLGDSQTKAFVAGIRGVTTDAANAVSVVIDSSGQLGTVNSSRQVKFDIDDMGQRTDGLMQLHPVTFRYKAHGDDAPLQYGLIAEEVAEVYPEMVVCDKNGKTETVLYQFLAPMLLNEVQQQRKTIDTLQKELATLREQVAALQAHSR